VGFPYYQPSREGELSAQISQFKQKGLIPTIRDGAFTLSETSVTSSYLDDKYDEPPLSPKAPEDRARMRLWMKLADETVHPVMGALGWPITIRPALMRKSPEEQQAILATVQDPRRRERQSRLLAMGVASPDTTEALIILSRMIAEMEDEISRCGPWLAGNRFSLADIAVMPYLSMLWQFQMTAFYSERYPLVADWFQRCQRRPSFERAIKYIVPDSRWTEVGTLGAAAWQELKLNGVIEQLPA
jgi:glutathione S-transferase